MQNLNIRLSFRGLRFDLIFEQKMHDDKYNEIFTHTYCLIVIKRDKRK